MVIEEAALMGLAAPAGPRDHETSSSLVSYGLTRLLRKGDHRGGIPMAETGNNWPAVAVEGDVRYFQINKWAVHRLCLSLMSRVTPRQLSTARS